MSIRPVHVKSAAAGAAGEVNKEDANMGGFPASYLKKFACKTADELEQEAAVRKELVPSMLAEGFASLISGPPGSGKSYLGIDAIAKLLLVRAAYGRCIAQRCGCLHAEEMPGCSATTAGSCRQPSPQVPPPCRAAISSGPGCLGILLSGCFTWTLRATALRALLASRWAPMLPWQHMLPNCHEADAGGW